MRLTEFPTFLPTVHPNLCFQTQHELKLKLLLFETDFEEIEFSENIGKVKKIMYISSLNIFKG